MKHTRALGFLTVSAVLIAAAVFVATRSQPVPLLIGSTECYDPPIFGDLGFDAATGSITLDSGGGPKPVQWMPGDTGRRSGSQVEILNRAGKVLYRTGTRVGLGGSSSPFLVKDCGGEILSYPSPS